MPVVLSCYVSFIVLPFSFQSLFFDVLLIVFLFSFSKCFLIMFCFCLNLVLFCFLSCFVHRLSISFFKVLYDHVLFLCKPGAHNFYNDPMSRRFSQTGLFLDTHGNTFSKENLNSGSHENYAKHETG